MLGPGNFLLAAVVAVWCSGGALKSGKGGKHAFCSMVQWWGLQNILLPWWYGEAVGPGNWCSGGALKSGKGMKHAFAAWCRDGACGIFYYHGGAVQWWGLGIFYWHGQDSAAES